jgi:DNA polymerase-3 subunit delta
VSLYVFHGPDQFRAREALSVIRSDLDKDGNLAHNTVRLEARGLTPGDLRAACHTASFFAEDRLVIVEGLMGRFGGFRRRGRNGRSATASSSTSELDQFVDVLTDLPPTTTVVLLDEQAQSAFLDSISDGATVRQFAILRGSELRQWTVERLKSLGAAAAPGAVDRLVSLVDGYHLGELAQELDKLATYANGRPIDASDIDALVSGAVQYQIWDLTDAVIEGRGDRALSVLRAMDARDHPRQLLIYMLTRQYRQLLLAQALLQQGQGANEVGSRLGLQNFPLRKVIDQAGRYAPDRLEAAYRRLLQTDVAVKTGVLDVDLALEMLIVDLAELARPQRRSRAAV